MEHSTSKYMAGVMMGGDEGRTVGESTVPAIGGAEGRSGLSPEAQTSKVAETAHLNDARAEGVAYNSDASIGETRTQQAYPAGTEMPGEHGTFGR